MNRTARYQRAQVAARGRLPGVLGPNPVLELVAIVVALPVVYAVAVAVMVARTLLQVQP